MTDILLSFHLTSAEWSLAVISAVLVGIAKTGISGAGMLAIPILAGIFGGKLSSGILLPMLCTGDVIGVTYYHRHADWYHLWRLLPWSLVGIVAGVIVGNAISDDLFTCIMAVTILAGIVIMVWQERRKEKLDIPDYRWFSAFMGLLGGFTSMIGNAAGPVMALYLLSMRIPKYRFIGTWAWFFLIVNAVKVPFHAVFWHTITVRTLAFDAVLIPLIALGAVVGITIVKKIPDKIYRYIIMVTTAIAAIKLFM